MPKIWCGYSLHITSIRGIEKVEGVNFMSMETEQAESIKKLSDEVNNLSQVVVKIKDCLIETNNSTKTIKIILIFWFILGLVPLAIFLFFFSYFQSRFQF